MTLNKNLLPKSYFFVLFLTVLVAIGCANIQKPQGGPRDRQPPKLLKATPLNMTRFFKAKQIQLDFDEYFQLKNQYQEIVISPAQEKAPEYKIRKKSLVITFKDTLKKNTTYVINFGKAIADVNESNVLENFTYVFSTGPHIDSLSVSGNVLNSITNQKEKDVTVMLIPVKQDSAIFGKKKPSIFATTDTSGNFNLNNLHEDDYRIYALKETSPNKIYDNDQELIAFSKKPIRLRHDTSGIVLNLFKQVPDKFRFTDKRFDLDGKMIFVFNRQLQNPSVKITYPPGLDDQKVVDFGTKNDTALLYMRNMDFDSVRVAFFENKKPIDTIALHKGRKETYVRNMTVGYNLNSDGRLKPGTELTVSSNYPIDRFDQNLFVLSEDSIPTSNFEIIKDTTNIKKLRFKYQWKQGSNYILTINEGGVTDMYGDRNKKTPPKRFTIDKPENYGTLTLKVTVPDTSKQYLVELLNDQKQVLRMDVITKNSSIVYRNYITAKYHIRVTYDDNRNGKWDSGNVKKGLQPEPIWVYNKDILLRANWEAEEPLDIPKEPVTP